MQKNKTKESLIMFLLIAAIAFSFEFLAFSATAKTHGMIIALIIHSFVTGALFSWVVYRTARNKNHRFATLLLVMTAATGPFGAGICLLTAVVSSYCALKAMHPSDWISA